MKKIIFFSFLFAFLSFSDTSFAESYPTTCPVEAQGILSAVGGCATINCNTYSNICAKCCLSAIESVKTPTKTSLPVSKPTVSAQKTVSPDDAVNPFTNKEAHDNFKKWISTSTDPVTALAEETTTLTPENKPSVGFIGFVKNIFTGFFKFFRFGR